MVGVSTQKKIVDYFTRGKPKSKPSGIPASTAAVVAGTYNNINTIFLKLENITTRLTHNAPRRVLQQRTQDSGRSNFGNFWLPVN